MHDVNLNDRLIFGNIYIKKSDYFVLLNLHSFRRMVISEDDLCTLLSCRDNLNRGNGLVETEKKLYDYLVEKKQIIPDDMLAAFLAGKEKEHYKNLSEIEHRITRVTISPTFSCNFNCAYCYQREFDCKSDYICADAVDDICRAIQEINKTDNYLDGIVKVTINGGEPLQTRNIETINRIVDRFAKPGVSLTLMTNGYNIVKFKDIIDFSRFDSIQISLDNIDPFASQINGVNHSVFKNVIDGLSYLMQFNCKVSIATIFTKDLVDNIDKFIEQLSSVGVVDNPRCQISITPVVAFGKSTLDNSFYTLKDFINAKGLLKDKKLPNNMTISGIPEARWIARAMKRKTNERIYGRPSMCSVLSNRSIHFAPNGKIYWCLCVNPEVGSLGNYHPFIEVDERKIDETIKKSVYSDEKCKSCPYKYLCSSGCPLHSVVATGEYTKPFCGFFFDPEFWRNLEDLLE